METTKVTPCHVCGKEKGSEEEVCIDGCDKGDLRDTFDEFQRD